MSGVRGLVACAVISSVRRVELAARSAVLMGDSIALAGELPVATTAFFSESGKATIALTVREILEEEIARKLA